MTLIVFLLFITYLVYTLCTFGVPTSLSDTYYLFNEKKKDLGILFTLLMWLMAFTLIISMIEITNDNIEFLPFLCVTGIGFVGAAPLFKSSYQVKIHFTGAILSAVTAIIWLFIQFPDYYSILLANTFLALGLIVVFRKSKCYLFFAEMILFFTVFEVVLLNL